MLKKYMYVRCPADWEDNDNPRIFVCGQIKSVDYNMNTVTVKIHDPFDMLQFYVNLPKGLVRYDLNTVQRCSLFKNSEVMYHDEIYKILCYKKSKDTDFYEYSLENKVTKQIIFVDETDVIASFNNGRVDPCEQLKRYEFQKSDWYIGHSIVSRNVYTLEHSFYGFEELAGSKIYLMPHQVNTIMRCLQDSPFRYMLADEVGMGKTIEAISILKIFINNKSHQNILIITPGSLKKQWENELLFKFNMKPGYDLRFNYLSIKTMSELQVNEFNKEYNLIIIDEVHKYLLNQKEYNMIHQLSKQAENILLLSATPIQQERIEYLRLLRLLFPDKYDKYSESKFEQLINKQTNIVQKSTRVIDDLEDFFEIKEELLDEGEDLETAEDLIDIFEEMYDTLESICSILKDDKLSELLENVRFDSKDQGEEAIRIMLSYICSNYQIEGNVIRNRRELLKTDEDDEQKMATRKLFELTYTLENSYENSTYESLIELMEYESIDKGTKVELFTSFFSSPWAFESQLKKIENEGIKISENLKNCTEYWKNFENNIVDQIKNILENPEKYEEECNTRIMQIMDFIDQNIFDEKIVMFTGYEETFEVYKKVLLNCYPNDKIAFFGLSMDTLDAEVNSFKFQNDRNCKILLCDYSGGEGRNFQCADFVIHIDLPWDANMIEQRIGRLDRLERDTNRNIVYSVAIHTINTIEDSLFKFWNEGLKIFTQSLSGMEIIIGRINEELMQSLDEDFNQSLGKKIPQIIKMSNTLAKTIKKEQSYDAAAMMYKPIFIELQRLIDFYTKNESELFTTTIRSWASLSGFMGNTIGKDKKIIEFSRNSFSVGTAIKSILMPPNWSQYHNDKQQQTVKRVLEKIEDRKIYSDYIRGTFDRKKAIENDYIHFFAPGDEIYECIVQNAMQSCKGHSTAFKVSSKLEWKGFVFTWMIELNEEYLLKNGVSLMSIGQFKNYLPSEQIIVPVSIENVEEYSDIEIIKAYYSILNKGTHAKDIEHLGRRGKHRSMLSAKIMGMSNLQWFQNKYPEEEWSEMVTNARNEAFNKAKNAVLKKIRIKSARAEAERAISAKIANSIYYGVEDNQIEDFKKKQEFLLNSLKTPRITLVSAAYVWMEKEQC